MDKEQEYMKYNNENDSIFFGPDVNIKKIFFVLWDSKLLIASFTGFFAIFSVLYSLSLPNIYTSSSLLKLSKTNDSSNALSSISSDFGGLASLAGISIPGNLEDESEYAMQTLISRDFVRHLNKFDNISVNLIASKGFDDENGKIIIDQRKYNSQKQTWIRQPTKYTKVIPTDLEVHRKYMKSISVSKDKLSGFISISFKHHSPVFAKDFLDLIIQELNNIARERNLEESNLALEYLENKLENELQTDIRDSINKLIGSQLQNQMLSNVKKDYLLELIDPPYMPEMKSAPSRAIICIALTLFGAILSILIALVRHNFKNT